MLRGICILTIGLAMTSCARTSVQKKGAQGLGPGAPSTNAPSTRPPPIAPGRIDSVNAKARYVVISFPLGTMPSVDSRLSVYRAGLKVAELKVTPPQQNNFTAADIIAGDCQVG